MNKKMSLLLTGCALFLIFENSYAGSATWNLNPTSGDWNTAANWTPATVPNGPSDTATFEISNTTTLSMGTNIQVDSLVFNPGGSAFTATAKGHTLTLSGVGISNNSGALQNLVADIDEITGVVGIIQFDNTATAGNGTVFTCNSSSFGGGVVQFSGSSTAGSRTFMIKGGTISKPDTGEVAFSDSATAGNGVFIVNGGSMAPGGVVEIDGNANAENGTFTINGGNNLGSGGSVNISGSSSAGNGTFIANGGTGGGSPGTIQLEGFSVADAARMKLFGGTLSIENRFSRGVTVGSIEGNGSVLTPFEQLTVGSNNLSTRFSGIIDDQGFGGSLAKVGTGKLVLSGANNYSNGTTINGGALLVGNRRGSATGSGAVQVLSGILGGAGSIAGPVTIGTGSGEGAFLAPSKGSGPKTLRILSPITLQSDATYNYKMNTRQAIGDRVIANGVTIESSAQISITFVGHRVMTVGTVFTLFSNTAVTPISGIFANLADGSTLTIGSNTLQASYSGGDGNDLTLTVVP